MKVKSYRTTDFLTLVNGQLKEIVLWDAEGIICDPLKSPVFKLGMNYYAATKFIVTHSGMINVLDYYLIDVNSKKLFPRKEFKEFHGIA